MDETCENCKHMPLDNNEEPCNKCLETNGDYWEHDGVIEFKKLNGLTPTIESCTMKLIEELGELLQLIGKGNQASGESKPTDLNTCPERMISEALDVAQSAVTMVHAIADNWGIDIKMQTELHESKLRTKGYLV